jgi:hypothetical protein
LAAEAKSIRASSWGNSQSNSRRSKANGKQSIKDLRKEFIGSLAAERPKEKAQPSDQSVFIWSKEYYFSYWGFRIAYRPADLTNPLQEYDFVNYEVDSAEEYDELNAEDLDAADENSSLSSDSNNNNSFVVSDNYHSEEEDK